MEAPLNVYFRYEEEEYYAFGNADGGIIFKLLKDLVDLSKLPQKVLLPGDEGGIGHNLMLWQQENIPQELLHEESSSDLLENSTVWTDAASRLLLTTYESKLVLFKERKIVSLEKMWKTIEQVFAAHGYKHTSVQIKNRWRTLEKGYKNVLQNKKKTGRGRKTCPYQKELENILRGKDNIQPKVLIGQGITKVLDKNGHYASRSDSQAVDSDESSRPSTSMSSGSDALPDDEEFIPGSGDIGNIFPYKQKRSRATALSELTNARLDMQNRHKEKIILHEEKEKKKAERHIQKMEIMEKILTAVSNKS